MRLKRYLFWGQRLFFFSDALLVEMFKGLIDVSLLFFGKVVTFFLRVDYNRDEFMQFSSSDYLDMKFVGLCNKGHNLIDDFTVLMLVGVEIDIEDVL